jgi:flagellar L-ring protein precursor FlgH
MKSVQSLLSAIVAIVVLLAADAAQAQRLNLYQTQTSAGPLTLEQNSWLFVATPPVREIQVNDLVTIIVNQKQQSVNEGQIQRMTQSNIDARLQDWVILDGLSFVKDPQTKGAPRARGQLNGQVRTNANLESSSQLQFTITATVVDIRPNGNLVVEAHSTVRSNEEIIEQSLSGIVRREDVLPDNTVKSEKVAELMVHHRETGHVNDAYTRGWLMKLYDKFKPF